MNKQIVVGDYRKWLLYSFDRVSSDHIYELFKALENTQSFGIVTLSKLQEGGTVFVISSEKVDEDLHITEDQKNQFSKYLRDNYFQHGDVEDPREEKTRIAEIAKNHKFISENDIAFRETSGGYKVKPHPKETAYYNAKLIFSILVYAVLLGVAGYNLATNIASWVLLLTILPIIGALFLSGWIAKGIFIGVIKGNTIQLTEEQYPEIYQIIKGQAQKIDVELPDIYIAAGHFNAFVTRFSRRHVLLIFSEVLETALKGNYDVLKYVTAHELCHIKQRHLAKRKWLLPSAIIPFLGLAYSRGCEYTCDRVGYDFSPKGSVEGVLIMTTGKEVYSKINVEKHIETSIRSADIWTWLSEKFLTHPHLYKRLVQIREYSRYS
jgi:Zn-dependent protease with chaperone function